MTGPPLALAEASTPRSDPTVQPYLEKEGSPQEDQEPSERCSGSLGLTMVESHRKDVVRLDRQPVHGQNLRRIPGGAQLEG